MSDLLSLLEHTIHTAALIFMGVVYVLRVSWFLRKNAGAERQPPTGSPGRAGQRKRGYMYSWGNVLMPGAMESTRTNLFMWFGFIVFHVGVAAGILLSVIVIPFIPSLVQGGGVLATVFMICCAGGTFIGVLRIARRVSDPYLRAISTPDDYFSTILITAWLFLGVLSAPHNYMDGEWELIAYYILTSLLLAYVPFSKVSHYLYYPFTRYYLGKSLGYRGVFPLDRKGSKDVSKADLTKPITVDAE